MAPKRVAAIIGSESDLWQWTEGINLLFEMQKQGDVALLDVHIASVHRRPLTLQSILYEYSRMPADEKPDYILTGAGWANHLSGFADAFLRYTLQDTDIVVIAIAMVDTENPIHTQAAILSTSEVPGTQAVFRDAEKKNLVGPEGVRAACEFIVKGAKPLLTAKQPPFYKAISFAEAYTLCLYQSKKKKR